MSAETPNDKPTDSTPASRREARKAEAAKAAAAKAQAASSRQAGTASKPGRLAKRARPARGAKRKRRTLSTDIRRMASPAATAGTEAVKLGREMLLIPAQAFMAAAELAGAGVLWIWRALLLPAALAIVALLRALLHLGQRHVTPARGVIVVAIFAAVTLAVSQWLDYRGVSVGSEAYSGSIGAVAPAPDVETERAGEAHAWVMLPLAIAAIVVVVVAARKRPGLARLLILIGITAIAISLLVDMPKALDESEAAIVYEGAQARLLDGFWMQLVTAAVLVACGALLPRYLRSTPAAAPLRTRAAPGDGSSLKQLAARARGAAKRAAPGKAGAKRKVQGAGT